MKVLILWTNWSGYMDACAKELQRLLACDLDIVYFDWTASNAPFSSDEFFAYPSKPYPFNAETFAQVQSRRYDLMLICSWHVPEYRALAHASRGRSIRVLCMDNQWLGSARQYLGIIAFRVYLYRLFDFAFVPGNRQARFAGYLGFGPHEIIEGHYACADTFSRLPDAHRSRSFLFVGRLVVEKGVHILAEAWRRYVTRNAHPWSLKVCGAGALFEVLKDLPSTELVGFVQPSHLPEVMASASAFVLPSLHEPWGVAIHEAAQAGLGLVLSSRCGAADYFLRDGLNGRLVPPGDASALCDALEWFHQLDDLRMEQLRHTSAVLAAQRSPVTWACAASRALALGSDR